MTQAPWSTLSSLARLRRGFAGLLLALVLASPAAAHDQTFPIDGDAIVVRTSGNDSFSFESIGPEVLLLGHDPTVDSSALLVWGVGANAGRTPLIPLTREAWATDGSGGFVYTDVGGSQGGITGATLTNGELTLNGIGSVFP